MEPSCQLTVIMANYNGESFIASALQTVLAQTLHDLEVLVVDDASTDRSVAIISEFARHDARVRLLTSAVNGGPAVARNIGLDQAQGRWIAIVDSDDMIHPERLERLVQLAEAEGSDIATDNLMVFYDDPAVAPHAFLNEDTAPRTIDFARYLLGNAYGSSLGREKLGHLKPLLRTEFVRNSGARYRPELQIAEDSSFVLTLLGAGARFHLFPDMTYFYRKHARSISHRLTAADLTAMIADDARFLGQLPSAGPAIRRAFAVRRRGYEAALVFDGLVQSLKAKRWMAAAVLAISRPRAAWMLRQPLGARAAMLRRQLRPPVALTATRPQICIITRRPVTTDRQEIMAPLIRLGEIFAAAGADAHLVIPTAVGPQQRKALVRAPGIGVFKTINTRPGPASRRFSDESWSLEEKLFVARRARPVADIVVADWLPGMEALPFVLRPGSLALALVEGLPRGIRAEQLAPSSELLSRADAIVAEDVETALLLHEICPTTPIVTLADGQLFGAQPNVELAALLAALWPQPSQPRPPLALHVGGIRGATAEPGEVEHQATETTHSRALGARGELQS